MEKSIFDESRWVHTLKQEELLKELLRDWDSGTIYFYITGDWIYKMENRINYPSASGGERPIFHLDAECLNTIENDNVEDVIINILRLLHLFHIFCVDYDRLFHGEFLEFVHEQMGAEIPTIISESKLDTFIESYHFQLIEKNYTFNFYISWNRSFNFKVISNNSKLGYFDYDGLMDYLIEEESINIKDNLVFFHFFEELRKFQKYFYEKTKSRMHQRLYTSFYELALLNIENQNKKKTDWQTMDTSIKIADILTYFRPEWITLNQKI